MKIVFVSNYFNHHEKPFCDALNNMPSVDFYFIQTMEMEEERIKQGWQIDLKQIPYCICSYKNDKMFKVAIELCNSSDVLIVGSAPYVFIRERIKKNKLTFFYSERLFRKGFWRIINPKTLIGVIKRFVIPGRKSNFYLLAASAYTAIDTACIHAFQNKRFKWGHFIDVRHSELKQKKEGNFLRLLWVGRFIKLKHPEYAIYAARALRKNNVNFIVDIIGSGKLETELKTMISNNNLTEYIRLHSSMSPEEVRVYMENADIFMFTSDFNEGWGAVLGESMSAGCAVVASHGIGATPFLLRHNENGLIYETGNYESFERNILKLVSSFDLRSRLAMNAIDTMQNLWNPQIAAERFYNLCSSIIFDGKPLFYEEGPISKALILKNSWFKDDTV